MSPAERRAYARSGESMSGSMCARCQRREGGKQKQKYKDLKDE